MSGVDLNGKRGLVIGVANQYSIAWGCAQGLAACGAEVALTYLNDKAKAYVQPLAEAIHAPLLLPCDVADEAQVEAVFTTLEQRWGALDFLVHSIAFAPLHDLRGRLIDSSREGFTHAMDISCHSLMRMSRLAEPLMAAGGTIFTMSYYGAEKVIPNYNLMGPVKAALECSVRYLALELAASGIRVHAISPGPVQTRAASGLAEFDQLLQQAASRSPMGRTVRIDEVGALVSFLASDQASALTGDTWLIDCGYHLIG